MLEIKLTRQQSYQGFMETNILAYYLMVFVFVNVSLVFVSLYVPNMLIIKSHETRL